MAWSAWLDMQWNRPSRSDHYAMQVAACTLQPHLKKSKRLKIDQMKLSFQEVGTRKRVSKEQAAEWSRTKWIGWLGGNVVYQTVSKPSEG